MGTIDPHVQFKSMTQVLTDLEGNIKGASKEMMALLRMDKNYIAEKKIKLEHLFPEVWDFAYPFKERGSFKKEFKMKYQYPSDSEFTNQIYIEDEVDHINLIIKLLPVYTRRFAKTLGYICVCEEDSEKIIISKDIS